MSEFNTPWNVKESSFNYKTCIDDCDGYFTAQVVLNNADLHHAENTTKHIVKCVNEHDALQAKADMCDEMFKAMYYLCLSFNDEPDDELTVEQLNARQALQAYNEMKEKNK